MVKRIIPIFMALILMLAIPLSPAMAASTNNDVQLRAGIISNTEGVTVSTQQAQKTKSSSKKITQKDRKAAIKTVKTFLNAAKTYNTKKMSKCFTNPKTMREEFFDSDKKTKFMVKYCKKYNKRLQYKKFSTKKTNDGLIVSCTVTHPDCSNVHFEYLDDFTFWSYDYYKKYGQIFSDEQMMTALTYYMKKAFGSSKYHSRQGSFDDPTGVYKGDWVRVSFKLQKVKGKWRMLNQSHIEDNGDIVWHDADIANLDFEFYTTQHLNSLNKDLFAQLSYESYLNYLNQSNRNYYSPDWLL